MSYRVYGAAIGCALSLGCGASAHNAAPKDAAGPEVTSDWAAPVEVEEHYPLNAVLMCEPVAMKVTPRPERAHPEEPKRLLRSDDVTVSIRCTNRGAKAIRGARGTLSFEGVFGETLLDESFEHVWPQAEPLENGEAVDFTLPAVRASAPLHSPSADFLRRAQLTDLGKRGVNIIHIAFVDGSQSRHQRSLDVGAPVSRNEVQEVR